MLQESACMFKVVICDIPYKYIFIAAEALKNSCVGFYLYRTSPNQVLINLVKRLRAISSLYV